MRIPANRGMRLGLIGGLLMAAVACAPTVTRHPDYGQDCETYGADVDCVRVFYGTNRQITLADAGAAIPEYDEVTVSEGTDSAGPLILGRADVWLPRLGDQPGDRQRGETPLVSGEAPQEQSEQEKYVFITRITATGRTRFVDDLQSAVEDEGDAVLLFVHGFNVGFDAALIRSAQLTFDLRQDDGFNPGAPVVFTWPSRGRMSLTDYRADERSAAEAVPRLEEFLDLLTGDLRVTRVNIIAHSMGNRVLTGALEDFAEDYLARRGDGRIEFRIILAAADVETKVYALAAEQIARLEPNVTIYTSDADRALQISRLINGVQRLGETAYNRPFIRQDGRYSTIDATPVATELFGVGHGYYSDNPFILNDIRCAMADRPAEARALELRRYGDAPRGDPYFRTDPRIPVQDERCSLRRGAGLRQDEDEPVSPPVTTPAPPREYTVYFGLAGSGLSPEMNAVVEQAARDYQAGGFERIRLIGYSDTSGSAAVNLEISRERAEAVRDRLVALGLPASMIEVIARGESDPAISTGDGVVEALNRRVVIEVQY